MARPNLLLLHGALGSKVQFDPLITLITDAFSVHTLDFEGHGASPSKDRDFWAIPFAENVLVYLDQNDLGSVNIFGHSMGGHIGLYLARHHPERVKRVFTFGSKLDWTPAIAEKEAAFMDPEKMREKVPQFADTLKQRHRASGWRSVVEKTRHMMLRQGKENLMPDQELQQIQHPVRLSLGDRDEMVSIEETVRVYKLLPQGELQIFPATPHPLEKAPLSQLADAFLNFFYSDSQK